MPSNTVISPFRVPKFLCKPLKPRNETRKERDKGELRSYGCLVVSG